MSEELGKEVEQPFWLSMDNAKVHPHGADEPTRPPPPPILADMRADLSTAHCCIHVLPDIRHGSRLSSSL
jgi:hypothetical protein